MPLPFANTDELFAVLPQKEDQLWEWKAASVLMNKNDLKKELGIQVSAFANSGGGNLIFGINDKTRAIEPCEEKAGNEDMAMYLSKMVQHAVDRPLQGHSVHPIPIADGSGNVIYLIQIPDSPSAPHQARENPQYYWRVGSRSEAAPHRHLELLRDRITRAVIDVTNVVAEYEILDFSPKVNRKVLEVRIDLTVENLTSTLAEPWAIRLTDSLPDPSLISHWICMETNRWMSEGIMYRGTTSLFPLTSDVRRIGLHCDLPAQLLNSGEALRKVMLSHPWTLQTFSQNHASQPRPISLFVDLDESRLAQLVNLALRRMSAEWANGPR